MEKQGLIGAFAGHAFLSGLSDRHLMRLGSGVKPFAVAAGAYLAREGEPAQGFYLIQSGRIAIGSRAVDEEFVPITTLGAGEVVGWSWLLPPHRWQFDCRATEPVQGLMFDAEWLRDQCETDHELGYHLLKHLLAVAAHRLVASRLAATRQGTLVPK